MHEWKAGQLHSGSKTGPIVKSQKQAVAIGLDEERRGQRMAMGGPAMPGARPPAQNRAIHATMARTMPPAMRPPAPMAPAIRPAPMPAAPNTYLGRYPMHPMVAPVPGMADGGQVEPTQYYAQGGETDVSTAARPVLPNEPGMGQPQGVGYANGGQVLSAADRRALPRSDFAVPSKAPGSGSYPMPDRAHAANAKARASQFGSPAVKAAVAAKAKAKFGMSEGGEVGTDPQSEETNERQARIRKFEKDNGDKEV